MYEMVVGGIETEAKQSERAYGGVVRSKKGTLVEDIAKKLLSTAWFALGKDDSLLKFNLHKKYDIPVRQEYVKSISDTNIRGEILSHIEDYTIKHGTDVHVYVDGEFVLSVECKAYAENAMLKRVLFDAYLLKAQFPDLKFALLQLESMLGGDYSDLSRQPPHGSKSAHTIMSYMSAVDLQIITLLDGERHVKRPLHKPEFYKPLTKDALKNAVAGFAKLLA